MQMTSWPANVNNDVLLANCERLGIPAPLVGVVANADSSCRLGLLQKGLTIASGATLDFSKSVPVLALSGSGSNRLRWQNVYIANDMTVLCVQRPGAQVSGAQCSFVSKMTGAGAAGSEWCLGGNFFATATDYKPWFGVFIGAAAVACTDTVQWTAGERLILAGCRRGTQVELWRQGQLRATASGSVSAMNNVLPDIHFGEWTSNTSFNMAGDYELVIIWDKAVPADILAQLTLDPYMLFDESPLMNSEFQTHNPIIEVSLTQGVVMSQVVGSPLGHETTVSSTMGRIGFGGRQITRINSRIYTVATDTTNNKTYVFYSDDIGFTWHQELVVNYAAASASISQGAGQQPVLCLVAAGTGEIRPYLRSSGGGWTHKTDVGTGSAPTCFSHQILYDGTNYHLIYGRINSSNNKREVRHSYSSNLTTWTHATIHQGLATDLGAHRTKALAACIDLTGNIHVAFCAPYGSSYYLLYAKRTGSTWAAAELMQNVGPLVDSQRATHLSIATDRNHKPWVFGCKTYSGNQRIFTQNRTGSSWSAEEKPFDVATDAEFPSIGFQDRQFPTVVFKADNDDGTVHKMVKKNGAWTRTIIAGEESAAMAEQVYDPRFNNAIPEQGSFVVFQESILVFVTSTLVWGDTGVASGDALFTQTVKTQGRDGVTDGLEMSDVLSDPNFNYNQSVSHTMPFSQVLSRAVVAARTIVKGLGFWDAVGVAKVSGGVTNSFPEVMDHMLFEDYVSVTKTRVQSVTHGLVMTQKGPGLTRQVEVEDDLEISHTMDTQFIRTLSVGNDLAVDDVVFLNKSVNVSVTHTVTMAQGLVQVRLWSYASTHYNPGWAAEYESQVTDFVIMGPDEAPTLSMTMPRPDFGDRDTLFWRTGSVRRNRTGQGHVFRVPVYEGYKFGWSGFLRKRAAEFRNIIAFLVGKNVRIRDHNGVWKHVIITGSQMTSSQSGPDYCNVELEVEEKDRVA